MIKHFIKSSCERNARKYGIKNIENFSLKDNNLVVGINGSGKTRLLNMIRDLCNERDYVSVYMDFSQLGNKYQKFDNGSNKTDKDSFNWALMYKLTDKDCEGLNDLVKFTNNSIDNLISFISKSTNINFADKRFSEINPMLYEILGRRIIRINNRFCITMQGENSAMEISKAIITMSPGERSLLYFVFQLVIIEFLNVEYVLLIDEPETHLHPIALTKLITYILENLNPVFSVICTHSVFLIPYYRFEEIKMMENGCIKKPSSQLYEDVYSSLIGFDNREGNSIYKFLSSIYEWNYSSFLAECFTPPKEVSEGNKNDKQFVKLRNVLCKYTMNETVNVLDYGAGSGRMAKCFELLETEDPKSDLWNKLKYSLYDKYIASDVSFKKNLWFDEEIANEGELYERNGKYDIVVLYNVLHEIPVTEWSVTLKKIFDLLNDNGCLLFGERKVLSEGEKPYGSSGYLILGKDELTSLFTTRNIERITIESNKGKDPTICYAIAKKDMVCPTNNDVETAVTKLKNRVYRIVMDNVKDGKKDREYAFYCQEYFNALTALKELAEIC